MDLFFIDISKITCKRAIIFTGRGGRLFVMAGRQFFLFPLDICKKILVPPLCLRGKNLAPPLALGKDSAPPPDERTSPLHK